MPQGSWLGLLSFLVLINDLSTGCPVHKYVDDTTLTELLPKNAKTEMSTFISNLLSWANKNNMEINTTKTKEMILGPLARSNLPFLSMPTGTIERVTSFKLLGLQIDSSLLWANHTTIIIQQEAQLSLRNCAMLVCKVVEVWQDFLSEYVDKISHTYATGG